MPGPHKRTVSGTRDQVLVTQSCRSLCDPMDCSPLAPLSRGFSRQEHRSGLPFPSPGDLPNSGFEPRSHTWQADSLPADPPGMPISTYSSHWSQGSFAKTVSER